MKQHYEYSKKIPIITGIIFLGLTIVSLFFVTDINQTVAITSISVSGGIFGSSIIWYLKKAQVENSLKIKTTQLEKITENRLNFIKESLKIQKEFEIDSSKINEIEFNSPIDEMEEQTMSEISQIVDSYAQDGHEEVHLQNY